MITGVNHIALAAGDPDAAASDFERVFGRSARRMSNQGRRLCHFQLDNLAFEIGDTADRPAGSITLAFATDDLASATRKMTRRGLVIETARDDNWEGEDGSIVRTIARLNDSSTNGISLALVEPKRHLIHGTAAGQTAVTALDHFVIRTRHPERAVALYGGRLGLHFALDRSNTAWKTRFLFFTCGGLKIEIVQALDQDISDSPDVFGGFGWHVADVDAARERLQGLGVETSEARTGRRPGSRVLTVRSSTCNVPTILLSDTG